MSAFLKTSFITAENSLDDSGSPCLTPMYIGNLSDTNSSKWIFALADVLYTVYVCFVYVSQYFKDENVFYCVKGFLVINEAYE